jgi:hypothetical protein
LYFQIHNNDIKVAVGSKFAYDITLIHCVNCGKYIGILQNNEYFLLSAAVIVNAKTCSLLESFRKLVEANFKITGTLSDIGLLPIGNTEKSNEFVYIKILEYPSITFATELDGAVSKMKHGMKLCFKIMKSGVDSLLCSQSLFLPDVEFHQLVHSIKVMKDLSKDGYESGIIVFDN